MSFCHHLCIFASSNARHRERHAKTLEIAQEEVLTCIGMCIYERLRRIYMCLKEEENACQVLAAVAVHALSRNFDMAVETKRGISNLELLYEEISRAEKIKEQRKEMKKLKKKKKKNEKRNNLNESSCHNCKPVSVTGACACSIEEGNDHEPDIEQQDIISTRKSSCCSDNIEENNLDVKDEVSVSSCHSCELIGCTKSIDAGYASEPSSQHDGPCSSILSSQQNSRTSSIASSPEGSEIACTDVYYTHDSGQFPNCHRHSPDSDPTTKLSNGGMILTLQQMLVKFK